MESVPDGCWNLLVRPRILVSKILPAFGMADEDELTAEVLQHRTRYLTGKRAFVLPEILSSEEKGRR